MYLSDLRVAGGSVEDDVSIWSAARIKHRNSARQGLIHLRGPLLGGFMNSPIDELPKLIWFLCSSDLECEVNLIWIGQ